MNTPTNPHIEEVRSEFDQGWLDMYLAASEGTPAWGEDAPPFIDNILPHIRSGSDVLELCCGDGRATKKFVEHGAIVIGLDVSADAIHQLDGNFHAQKLKPPMTVIGSATKIPLGDEKFDAVICINGICQIDRPRLTMEEAARVLRPGGIFIFDVFTPLDQTFGAGEKIGPGSFLYKGCLFAFYTAEQFADVFKDKFRVKEMTESAWDDPPHGSFRPQPHRHHALIYVLEKI